MGQYEAMDQLDESHRTASRSTLVHARLASTRKGRKAMRWQRRDSLPLNILRVSLKSPGMDRGGNLAFAYITSQSSRPSHSSQRDLFQEMPVPMESATTDARNALPSFTCESGRDSGSRIDAIDYPAWRFQLWKSASVSLLCPAHTRTRSRRGHPTPECFRLLLVLRHKSRPRQLGRVSETHDALRMASFCFCLRHDRLKVAVLRRDLARHPEPLGHRGSELAQC